MEEFAARNSRSRLAMFLLGAIAFVCLGLWMVGSFGEVPTSSRYSPAYTIGLGWIGVVVFGFCAVAITKRLLDRRIQLSIGPDGIAWAQCSDQPIPWSEIRDVSTWIFRDQKFIILHLKDPSLFPRRGLSSKLAGANRMLTGGDICISLIGTDRSYVDAISAIELFRSVSRM